MFELTWTAIIVFVFISTLVVFSPVLFCVLMAVISKMLPDVKKPTDFTSTGGYNPTSTQIAMAKLNESKYMPKELRAKN